MYFTFWTYIFSWAILLINIKWQWTSVGTRITSIKVIKLKIRNKCTCHAWSNLRGEYTWNLEIRTYICSCHKFFSPFFCANTFETSLLLIGCALRWYVKSLYRHLFLEDISKHVRVTQKIAPPICANPNSLLWSRLFSTHNSGGGGGGGFHGKNNNKAALPQIGGAIFLVTLACLDISSKKRDL